MASSEKRGVPECGFSVDGTQKGSIPIKVESRAKGKKVTILSNVRGNGQLLCSTLSSLLGIGGTIGHEAGQQVIQLQGSQQERVTDALRQLKCLRGVKEDEKPKKPAKQAEVASRHCAYDKFLRQDSKPSLAKMLESEAYAPKCLPGAECYRWHGFWVYCRGCCEQTDDDDVWEEGGLSYDPSLDKPQGADEVGAPMRPTNLAQLDGYLRKLGMLAEVGEAAVTWGLRNELRCAPLGTTLAEYRRMAVGPGASLIESDTGKKRRSSKKPKEKVKATPSLKPTQSLRSQSAIQVPQEEGCFRCPVCQNNFGLYKTLKTHMKLSHNMAAPVKALVSVTPKQKPRSAVSRASSIPARARPTNTSRWERNTGLGKLQESEKPQESLQNAEPLSPTPSLEPPLEPSIPTPPDPSSESAEWCENCPICQQSISLNLLQRHVEACLENPMVTQQWQTCPVCEDKFHPDAIDAHVRSCLDEVEAEEEDDDADDAASEDSDASDGIAGHPIDLNGYPVVRLRKAFMPCPPDVTQIAASKDDLFLRLWQQPEQEGGYWAWGCLVTWEQDDYYGVKLGYIPLSHLAENDVSKPEEAQTVRRWGRR